MLCQQTLPKRWFANVNMTSYYDVTNRVYAVTMTTIRHCSVLDFAKGEYNQEVAPGITRPRHATAQKHRLQINSCLSMFMLWLFVTSDLRYAAHT